MTEAVLHNPFVIAYLLFLLIGVGSFIGRHFWRRGTVTDREYRLWEVWYYIFEIGQAAWAVGLVVWLHS